MRTAAFIPLRGGSLSIPLKNIKPLNGHPLAYYVLDAADACSEIDTVVVATDSDLIKEAVLNHHSPKIQVISRSLEVSTAEASTESVMLEFAKAFDFQTIVLIQATSPLLKAEHLFQGLKTYSEGFDSVLSVVRRHNFLWSEDGCPLNYRPDRRPRRQDWGGVLMENGAFYITSRRGLLQSGCRLSGKIGLSEMPAETYAELDDPADWLYVESLLQRMQKPEDLSAIKLFLCDCDGTLTDSGMYYSAKGEELKKFNTRDGHAFHLLNEAGIVTCVITGENSPIAEARGLKIKAKEICLGVKDKLACAKELARKYGCSLREAAFAGDDLNDVELLKAAGFSAVPADAVAQAKAAASYTARLKGGEGAVREITEYLLNNRKS